MSNSVAEMNHQLIEIAGTSLDRAVSLPGTFYTSQAYFDHEVETLLKHQWHCLGRADEIPQPGDYFTAQLYHEPLLVVRGDDGSVRVLSNVCRHRGMPVAQGSGSTRRFICSYHAWSYNRDGGLANAPRMRDKGLDKSKCGLAEFRSEIWNGFLYVNLDDNAKPLTGSLGSLENLLSNYRTNGMRFVYAAEEIWNTNWKCLVENFMESYHLSVVHPETLHSYTPTGLSRKALADQTFTSYCANYPNNIPSRGAGALDLSDEERQRSTLFCLFPTQVASQAASLLVSLSLLPIAVDRVGVRWTMSVHGDDLTQDDIDERIRLWTEVNREDREKLERMQVALSSRHALSGLLAPSDYEGTVWDFYQFLVRGMNSQQTIAAA